MPTLAPRYPLASGLLLCCLHGPSHAIDAASIEFLNGNQTRIIRVAMQSHWQRQWWQSNGTHLGGYWDIAAARWRQERFHNIAGARHSITNVSLTPMFRLQRDDRVGLYAEAGIGLHYLSDTYSNNGHSLSGDFQFGTLLGAGYVFANRLDLGLRAQHVSNGGLSQPNDGADFYGVRLSYRFR